MTRPEFLRGWLLLTTQPWGKAYRDTFQTGLGAPSPAEIQAEFYYKVFAPYDIDTWTSVCELYAQGDHWPSIDQLKVSLKQYAPTIKVLPAPEPEYVTMEEALADHPEAKAVLEKLLAS